MVSDKEFLFISVNSTPLSEESSAPEKISPPEKIPGSPLRVPPSPSRFSMSPKLSRLGSLHPSLSQILKATRNFSPSMQIGEGGFGTVYKAQLEGGQFVAIKRAKKVSGIADFLSVIDSTGAQF